MFPQSELDNYKLQVELLQEKLQRSEISRQHLEHKLDKILHRREELDKDVRSKNKQKYQQFLEEQHRRNERNKQLVKMLECIEKQTEAMNARSERLKMMKLQYEMYFAKLVHSQTRRCIQSSVPTVTTPMMPPTTLTRPLEQTMMPPKPTVMEEYNYTNNMDPQLMATSYQRYSTAPNLEREQYLRSQTDNVAPLRNMEMPTLANYMNPERNDYLDFRDFNSNGLQQNQKQYQFQPRYETREFMENQPNDNSYGRMERDPKLYTSSPIIKESPTLLPVTSSLARNEQPIEQDDSTTISTSKSLTFDKLPSMNMMSNNCREGLNTNGDLTGGNQSIKTNEMQILNNEPISKPIPEINKSTIISQQRKIETSSPLSQKLSNEMQNKIDTNVDEIKTHEVIPKIAQVEIPKSYEVDRPKPVEQIPETVINAPLTIANNPSINKNDSIGTKNLPNSSSNNIIDSTSSITPVSIENIENAIYGELLTPLEAAEDQQPETSNLPPSLLDNLVTQPEIIETNNIPLDESKIEPENYIPDATTTNYDNTTASNEYEQQPEAQNYEQTYDYNNTNQQSDASANNNYAGYENVENTGVDESQPQDQQQYDYTNYDPSQYSYPGYIYDETTGEYKPDPNAPPEQYATDQQYTAEGYDQQQYQQQEEGYDYNQTYGQDPTTNTTPETAAAYENYDTTTQQQENTSDNTQLQGEVQQEQLQQQAQPEEEPVDTTQSESVAEEVNQTPAKVTKPTSILSTAEKNEAQKKQKKRVNFVDSSETDESVVDKAAASATKSAPLGNVAASSESDFDFSSSTDAGAKST